MQVSTLREYRGLPDENRQLISWTASLLPKTQAQAFFMWVNGSSVEDVATFTGYPLSSLGERLRILLHYLSSAVEEKKHNEVAEWHIDITQAPVVVLGLRTRAFYVLLNEGIYKISELLECEPQFFLKVRNSGKKVLGEIQECLASRNLHLSN